MNLRALSTPIASIPKDLPIQQECKSKVVAELAKLGPMTAAELARRLGSRAQRVSNILADNAKRGHVVRVREIPTVRGGKNAIVWKAA